MATSTIYFGIDLEEVFIFLYRFFISGQSQVGDGNPAVFFYGLWEQISFIGALVTPVLLVLVAYVVIRMKQIRLIEMEEYKAKAKPLHEKETKNERWERVVELVSSDRPNDWRQAVLEADVMLEEALSNKGYKGEGIGERLRAVAREDLLSLRDAWEAHKIRNEIAHAGSDFILTKREARLAVELYRNVFEEMELI